MFKFFRIRSRFFIWFTWFLLTALFADTVNLDDYLPKLFGIVNSIDLHLDDIDMADPGLISEMLPVNSDSIARQANCIIDDNNIPQNTKEITVLYDLDSLALAASYAFEKETVINSIDINLVENTIVEPDRDKTNHFLYLQFRSLLI